MKALMILMASFAVLGLCGCAGFYAAGDLGGHDGSGTKDARYDLISTGPSEGP